MNRFIKFLLDTKIKVNFFYFFLKEIINFIFIYKIAILICQKKNHEKENLNLRRYYFL